MSQTNRKSNWLDALPASIRWRDLSLRAKLITTFLAVTIIPLALVAFLNDRNTRQALTEDANTALLSAASSTAAELDTFMLQNLDYVRTEALLPDFVAYLSLPASQRADQADEITAILSVLAQQDPTHIDSIAILDLQGNTLVDTFTADIGVNKADRPWFKKAVETGKPVASNVEFSQTTGAASIYFSDLVRDASGKNIGVFRVRYLASILQDLVSANNDLLGTGSFAVLLDAQDHVRLAHGTTPSIIFKSVIPLDAATVSDLQARRLLPPGTPQELSTNLPDFEAALENYQTQPYFLAELKIGDATLEQGAIASMTTQDWHVVYAQSQDAFLSPINTQARNNIILSVVIALVVAGFAVFISATLAGPIVRLTQTAETIAGGNINLQAKVESGDEIGKLAGTFNRMTKQLRDFIASLEARVAERTRNLELAGEVGRTVSQVRALDVMLKDAAELIRKQFDLYYVQVYLVDASQTNLILQSGTGTVGAELVGRSHRLPLTTASINGRAAIEKKSVVISNTTESPTFKPNPLLPDTRSEMAVPLMIGERVVGVLDMQSEHAGALSADILTAFEAMAGQLAIAIQNATFNAQTEQARAEVEAQARRLSRANWVDYLDAIHKPEESGFVFEQNKISARTGEEQVKDNALTAPISVTGEALGNLVVEMEGQSPIAYTSELVNTVAQQVARQIESLRLLDSAERYRAEAEEASRRITREGWKDYRELNAHESLSFIYDLNEVRPFDQAGDQQTETSAFNLPIKVRDETVGKLVVHGLEADNSEALELANAVAERLGAHIETLRQFDETQRSQVELDKRAGQLAAVAEVSSVSAKELDIQKLLEAVVHLTQRKFGLYHAHVFTFNQRTAELQIAACGWKEGDEHEGTHGTTAIPLEQEQSLVARAARTHQAVIVNDVRNEAGWLPNPLLPDTASEMAVPLVIGEQVLGVLDVQSDRLNAFTEADANIYTTLASQVSTSLQNARSFALAQTQADRESMLNTISQKIQSATTVEAVLQIAARELGHALNAPLTIAQLGMK